ncbi:MAG: hypothetical protein H6732_18675 [Alphaproteobacteria bacterium]|nr:hypothetical protein [Alphaproteobacteria bacterium]
MADRRVRILLAAVVAGAVLAGAWGLRAGGSGEADAAVRSFLVPYEARLRAGEEEAAWRELTSERYRAHTPLLVYRTGQARNREELGPVRRLIPAQQEGGAVAGPDGRVVLRLPVAWEGREATAHALFDLVREQDRWVLERTWAVTPGGLAAQRVY